MNAGRTTVDWLFTEQLKVDAKWSVRTQNGFTWWAHQHSQQIEVLGEVDGPGGDKGYIIRIRTQFVKVPDLRTAGPMLDLLMSTATTAGPVYDPSSGMLYLSSAVLVHDGIWHWMARILSVVAMQQIADAHFMADSTAKAVGGKSATSGHPTSGMRPQPDELAVSFPGMCSGAGQRVSQWRKAEFDSALRQFMQRPPAVMASGGGDGVTIEFPYGSRTSLCRMVADEGHPRIGNGLLVVQSFPVEHLRKSEGEMRGLALQLNQVHLSEDPVGYGLGSFCYRDGCIHFNTFLPNLVYAEGLLPNLYFQCAARAAAMAKTLLLASPSSDAGESSKSDPKSALERLLGVFKWW